MFSKTKFVCRVREVVKVSSPCAFLKVHQIKVKYRPRCAEGTLT